MNRRGMALGAVGLLAAAAGAGVAWHRHAAAPGQGGNDGDGLTALWALQAERPDGGTLTLADARGRPLLVNFWATWCAPCVEEMPLLDRYYRAAQADGWRVVGLALEGAEPVRRFLRERPVTFPIGLLGADGVTLARALGNLSGGLPFSVYVDAVGRIADRRLGKLDEARLAAWRQRAAALK